MKWIRRVKRILLGVAIGYGLLSVILPRMKPVIDEYKEKLAEAIEEGKEAAKNKEEELEKEISQQESAERESPRYII